MVEDINDYSVIPSLSNLTVENLDQVKNIIFVVTKLFCNTCG